MHDPTLLGLTGPGHMKTARPAKTYTAVDPSSRLRGTFLHFPFSIGTLWLMLHDDASIGSAGPINEKAVQVYLENQAAFKGFLRRRLPSDQAAEDLLQQSVLKAIRDPEGITGKENMTAWFYRVLRNGLTDFYRARAAEGRKQDGYLNDLMATGAVSEAPPDAELMQEVCACLDRLLPTLKPEYAGLVQRIDLGGEEPAAVADSEGITYNNLMVRLHRARRALRKSLENSCGACTLHGCLDCTCGSGQGAGSSGKA